MNLKKAKKNNKKRAANADRSNAAPPPKQNEFKGEVIYMPDEVLAEKIENQTLTECVLCGNSFTPENIEEKNILGLLVTAEDTDLNEGNSYFIHARHLLDRNKKRLPGYDVTVKRLLGAILKREAEITKTKRSEVVETVWREKWLNLVCDKNGVPDLEKVKLALCDFTLVQNQSAAVYSHLTDGVIDNFNALAKSVVAVAEDLQAAAISAAVMDAVAEERARIFGVIGQKAKDKFLRIEDQEVSNGN
jgi:hypothetical protein